MRNGHNDCDRRSAGGGKRCAEAVTQIHEQTISFMLKLIVVILVLLIGGSWMLTTLQDYTKEIFALIAA